MKQILCALVYLTTILGVFSNTCTTPGVHVKSFTNQDATIVTNIAFIAEFSITCANGAIISNLYADIGNNLVPVARTGDGKYQVSWTEEIRSASSGDRAISLYDNDGYTLYRKAVRAGEDVNTVPTLIKISITHPGAFQGPWLKSEFLAASLSLVVAYLAFSSRAKLLS